jgi:hypothetical protein
MVNPQNLNPAALALANRAWDTILFPHDHRPGPNASLAQSAALRIFTRNGSPDQSRSGGHSTCQREIEDLQDAEVHCVLSENYQPKGGGGEHLVFRTEPPDGLIYKATWRGQFGFIPAWDENDELELRPASPSEYLLRCGLANAVFGDDIQLWCIAQDQAGNSGIPSIVTTQPFIVGRPAEEREIKRYLKSLGFLHFPVKTIDPSGIHDVWYRLEDQVMVCDAVSGNFVYSADGTLAAIDLPMAQLSVSPQS